MLIGPCYIGDLGPDFFPGVMVNSLMVPWVDYEILTVVVQRLITEKDAFEAQIEVDRIARVISAANNYLEDRIAKLSRPM